MGFKCTLSQKTITETSVIKKEDIITCNTILSTLKPKGIHQVTCLAFNNQAQTFVHDEKWGGRHKIFVMDAKDYHVLEFSLYLLFLASHLH